ncbi:MAG: dTMP kinase [Patescibacteria group bacterium]
MNNMDYSHDYPGKLIILEGGEGAGKTTLIPFLKDYLQEKGYEVVATKEPDCGTKLCRKYSKKLSNEKIKLFLEEMLDLLMLCRKENYGKIVIPALRKGKMTLCDRSYGSAYAYQYRGYGLDLNNILKKDALARRNVYADLILLLDIDPVIGLERKKREGRFEKESLEFHKRVRDGYLEQLRLDRKGKHGVWHLINAENSTEETQKKAIEIINQTILKNRKE